MDKPQVVMTIIDALKRGNVRISTGSRWLFWDEDSDEWVVLDRPYATKKNRTVYRGADIAEAVKVLTED